MMKSLSIIPSGLEMTQGAELPTSWIIYSIAWALMMHTSQFFNLVFLKRYQQSDKGIGYPIVRQQSRKFYQNLIVEYIDKLKGILLLCHQCLTY